MDTLANRQVQRATQRAAIAPNTPYESQSGVDMTIGATVDFASTASGSASAAVDVPVSTALNLSPGAPVVVSAPGVFADGISVVGKVKTGGAAIRLQLINNSGSTYDAASTQVLMRVAR